MRSIFYYALICISLVTSDIEYLFVCLITLYIYCIGKMHLKNFVMFSFNSILNIFLFLLWLPLWSMNYLEVYCLMSKYLGIFQIYYFYWPNLISLWLENIHSAISIVWLNLLRFVLMPRIWFISVNISCSLEYSPSYIWGLISAINPREFFLQKCILLHSLG